MLLRKTIRAMRANKRSYIACVFLIAVGIMMFLSMHVAGDGLKLAMNRFYSENRLAHVFAKVDAMPVATADQLARIDGVALAEPRYVLETRVELAGSDEIITLRLIAAAEDALLNSLLIYEGSPLAGERDLLVNTTFYDAHGLTLGDTVTVFSDGQGYPFSVCGTAMSPEYAYITRGETDILPDHAGFGIGYISGESMARLTNSAGLANDVVLALENGVAFDDVKIALEDALAPYGLNELIDREDQLSYTLLKMEVETITQMASALPMVFVTMATVVLYLMMKRVTEQDRTQIGTLKALGYSNVQVLAHYISYGAITGVLGGVFGSVAGYALSGVYLGIFLQFFLLPEISSTVDPKYIAMAFVIAVGGGVAGSFLGAFQTLTLTPSEAMRPVNPKPVKYDIVGKMKFLTYVLTSRGSMALRGIARNPMRSGFVIIGVTFSFGLLSFAGSISNMVDKLVMAQFTDIQRYGVKITLARPTAYDAAVEDAYAIEHVTRAEGILEAPVTLRHRHLSEDIVLTGIVQDAALYKVADTNNKKTYPPPTDSVILTNAIATALNAAAGDVITISSPLLREDIPIAVSRVVEQNLSSGCYIELGTLSAMLGLPETVTAVVLDTDDLAYLKEYLKGGQNVAAIDDKDSTLAKYQEMMGMYTSVYLIIEIMCVCVAFAIIYNTATISLSERKREYATLRVLGMTVNEVCEIMRFEYWVLSAVAMALGVPFTLWLNSSIQLMMDSDLFTMPSTLPMNAFMTGVVGCAAAVMLSNRSAKTRIQKLDMVEVLKERE